MNPHVSIIWIPYAIVNCRSGEQKVQLVGGDVGDVGMQGTVLSCLALPIAKTLAIHLHQHYNITKRANTINTANTTNTLTDLHLTDFQTALTVIND